MLQETFFYNPTIFRITKYKLIIKIKLNKITNQRNFGVLNKFLKFFTEFTKKIRYNIN